MSQPLTIIARIQAAPGQGDALEEALRTLVGPTLAEPGCLNYDLHRSVETPGLFLFYENWQTKAQWETHMESDHLRAYKESTADLVADFELLQMEPVK